MYSQSQQFQSLDCLEKNSQEWKIIKLQFYNLYFNGKTTVISPIQDFFVACK